MQSNDERHPSRRGFVGTLGTGVAAALAASGAPTVAQTQTQTQTAGEPPQDVVRNPDTEHPRPPFPEQQQPWPGLVSRMNPRPDHGETSYRGTNRLLNRRALITGGDSGMGRAAAIAYAREGADVAINYLPAEEPDAREVAQYIRQAGRKAVLIPGDIRSEAFCNQLVARAVQQLGGLDIVINNAGRQHALPSIDQLTTELFDWTYKTNVYAMFWITKAALPHMQPGSVVINTASEQAVDPSPNIIDYASTKAAIMNWTKGLAKQLATRGIRVNGVAPGPIWTPLQVTGGQDPSKIPQFGANTPIGRAGQPVELAPLYVTLAAAESSYSTGQIFGAQGGNGAT